ncbi:MAG: ABC transporter substrate-binding protein, partial [Myxococcales bacterium]|nr:ABC transporter substrate-binding protein [Myxococcales bacterium]
PMIMKKLAALALVLLVPTLATAASGLGPMATLKQKNGDVDKLLRQKAEKGSPAEQKQKDDIKKMAATLLDYDELAEKALAAHWDKLTPAQRTEFVTTLRELIERNYVKQLRTNLDYQVQYQNEELNGEQATVTTIVKVKSAGKHTDAEIIYKMKKDADGWRVWDVITDEVSLVKNYRTQFNKIITEQSYDALIKKMKSKLKDGE